MGPVSIIGIVSFAILFIFLIIYVIHIAKINLKEQEELANSENINLLNKKEDALKKENVFKKSINEPQTNTILKGVLGELIFSFIGVAIWVLMYQIGYLVGLFGIVIMAFTLMGWKWFKRKKLPRAAFFGAAIICSFQIIVAELISLVVEVMVKQSVNLIDGFTHTINWFKQGNMGYSILIDTGIGLVVAALTMVGFILYQKYNFNYRKQK